jgi:putative N6-adenine-specific DNA methylase
MCGSGTLLTEAALYARNQAPNLNRTSFGFQHWKNYEASLFEQAQAQAKVAVDEEANPKLIGFDRWPAALEEARTNAVNAGVDDLLRLSLADFFEKEAIPAPAMLLLNPPYGERLETEAEINVFYRRLGDRLKQAYKGYTAWIISANLPALKNLGLKPSAKHHLYNGNLPAQLAKYELY